MSYLTKYCEFLQNSPKAIFVSEIQRTSPTTLGENEKTRAKASFYKVIITTKRIPG